MPGFLRRYHVLGVGLDDLAFADAVALLRAALSDGETRTVFFANANTLNLAAASAEDRQDLDAADFLFGDGTGVRWAARMHGMQLRANLNGTDLLPAVLAAADADNRSCYLLGDTPDVLARTVEVFARRYPGWRVAGHHHGFIGPNETVRVRREIETSRPDLLLVAMGNPLQERWIVANQDLPVRVAIGVGALFAYLSGKYPRAPATMRRLGVEWLFVIFSQRHKARRYLFGAPTFLFRALTHASADRSSAGGDRGVQ